MTRIRHAETDDAEAIGRIQVAGWRVAYRHILPAAFLDGLDEATRAAQWRGRIGPASADGSPTFVALDEKDAVRGFTHTGPARDEDVAGENLAEVYTVYVSDAWRGGIGSALMAAVDDFWRPTDVTELVLWVFEENAEARAFYERLGWHPDGATQVDDFGGVQPVEVRYRRPLPRQPR